MSNIRHLNLSQKGHVFDPRTGESYQLNLVGQKIISYFQAGHNAEETARLLAKEFGLAEEKAYSDVLEFQVQLAVMGLAS